MIDIEELRQLGSDRGKIELTAHVLERMKKRKIDITDIYGAIDYGEIIEQYPKDFPYPSCLILYFMVNDEPLHLVCSIGNDKIYIITAYIPNLTKWNNDFKTRKAGLE